MADPSSGWLVALPSALVLPFKGTFRMPFATDTHGRPARSDRKSAAFYLADDLRTLILVRPTERSIGSAQEFLAASSAPCGRGAGVRRGVRLDSPAAVPH